MPVRRHQSHNSRLPEAQHTPHTKFTLCVHKRTPLTAWWSCPEEFWWAFHWTDSLGLVAVKFIGHPFYYYFGPLWSASLCFKVQCMKTEIPLLSCAGASLQACRPFVWFASCHVSSYWREVMEALVWGSLTECVWSSSSKVIQMKRPPVGRHPPPLSLAPHVLVPYERNLPERVAEHVKCFLLLNIFSLMLFPLSDQMLRIMCHVMLVSHR